MSEILSIKTADEEINLEANKSDHAASALKFFAPFVAALTAAGLMGAEAPAICLNTRKRYFIHNPKSEDRPRCYCPELIG